MSRNLNTSLAVNEILKYITFTGMVGAALVVPNAAQIGEKVLTFLDKRSRKLKGKEALQYMKHAKLIDYRELPDGHLEVTITEKGKKRVTQVNFDNMKIKPQKKWDGKWRLVMFDVPESRKKARRSFSAKLRELGFYQLQKSVWVHAYPCAVEVETIKQVIGIPDKDVIIGKISDFDNTTILQQHFRLSK